MPIQSGDVKLLKSAVMADVPEGGGAPTGVVIADGVSNAIFPDISELDRAGMPSTGSASIAVSAWRKTTVKTRASVKVSSKRPVLPPTGIAAHARNCSTVVRVTHAMSGAPTRVIGRPACRVADWIN